MKNLIKIILINSVFMGLLSCDNNYIDDISEVSAGTDSSAPTIEISSPTGNITIPYTDTSVDQPLEFKVTDDIEIAEITATLDGTNIGTYNSFLDYRSYSGSLTKNLGIGSHTFTVNAKDLSGKTTTKSVTFTITNVYTALYHGEQMYVPFSSGNVFTDLLSGTNPTSVGSPTTASGYSGSAYKGATDSYISYPFSSSLYSTSGTNPGISFTFWYKVNSTPDRAGIITINDNANNTDENRTKGLRLFREGSATSQRIKLNVGIGSGESWNDGEVIAVDGTTWVHIAVTVSPTESKIYFNGVLKRTSSPYSSTFDFSESTSMVVGSGAPSFSYWNHLSDLSMIDELRVYNKALSPTEIAATMQ